jgi:biotin operon repressor
MVVETFKDYIDETLGIQVRPMPWTDTNALPFLLKDRYDFFTILLFKTKCLLMVPKSKTEETPAVVRKHLEMAKQNWEGDAIYVPSEITSFNRKRLIQQKVPFIVPGNQLYLPDLGLDLREHFKKPHIPQETFSPATQVIVLEALVHGFKDALNGLQLGKKFGYSLMTITRALNELEESGLGVVRSQGRERKLNFDLSKKDLWKKAQSHFQNPIKRQYYVSDINLKFGMEKIESGLTALAHYSNLTEPEQKTYAFSLGQFKAVEKKNDLALNHPTAQTVCLEVWTYDPSRLANQGVADPFSIYLCLRDRDNEDERVHQALEHMMETVKW